MFFAACAEESGPPPTEADVIAACREYNDGACHTLGRCIGWAPDRVQQCINEENAKCDNDVQPEWCWETQRDALERCSATVDDKSCSDVCSGNFCGVNCLYFCPPAPEQ